jgi:hypothetical protein
VEPPKAVEVHPPVQKVEEPVAAEEIEVVCRGCGHRLELEEFYCGICGASRPSEDASSGDLQSKWASLWHLKQAADIRKSEASEESDVESEEPAPASKSESLSPDLEPATAVRILPTTEQAPEQALEQALAPAVTGAPWTSANRTRQWLDSFTTQPRRRWLARHRANLYLATAGILLFAVIAGWGSRATSEAGTGTRQGKGSSAPQLSLFEKALVDLGLAVPPPSPSYRGNPDARVWEDERTALYYCSGSDLYGKTERGKFSTQHEAQLDQFEPAFRRPCD